MRIKDMLWNLLNVYSKEEFHNELDKYIRLVKNTKSKELNKLFTSIQSSIFDTIKGSFPQSNPFVISFPYLINKHHVDHIYIILVEIQRPQFNLDGNLKSFLCYITAYNCVLKSDIASRLSSAVNLEKSKCKIENIHSSHMRLGLGSFLLQVLENIMDLYPVEKITGWLSPADFQNRHIHEKFYPKNGYSIGFTDETRENGWIEKILKCSPTTH